MLSYRHGFHAGNHADVLKHSVLVACLEYFTQKPQPITCIDTHAGAGLYRLDGDFAQHSQEAQSGILRLAYVAEREKELPTLVARYWDEVRGFNSSEIKVYPGSPALMQNALRSEVRDTLRAFELHAKDYRALREHIEQLPNAKRSAIIELGDGFEGLMKYLPPASRRALVCMDPSYEIKSDYSRVTSHMQEALTRCSQGTYCIWHPIIPREAAHDLPRKLRQMAERARAPWLYATLGVGRTEATLKSERSNGLNESGVFIFHPPYTLLAELKEALPWLAKHLSAGRGERHSLIHGNL